MTTTELTPEGPLRVEAINEGSHPEDPVDLLWSESYYLDAVSDDGSTGIYFRLGDTRNQGVSIVSMAIVRPGLPPIVLNDERAPAPLTEGLRHTVTSPDYTAVFEVTRPVEEFRVTFNGAATEYPDNGAHLRGEAGTPVAVAADLVWTNSGVDYQWKVTTRYEIPSLVNGTVTIDGVETTFSGHGQRDHSWGSRDWWGHEWTWSAFQLDDGTLVHGVNMRDTEWMFGYVQREGEVTELMSGSSTHVYDGDGAISGATMQMFEADLDLTVTPTAYGSLLLTSPTGRTAHFIRAMAEVTTADGRSGRGWIEWECVQPQK